MTRGPLSALERLPEAAAAELEAASGGEAASKAHGDGGVDRRPAAQHGRSYDVNIEFVAGFATVTSDPEASAALYRDALGLPLAGEGGYLHTDSIPGTRHFGIWPLAQAAESCFGRPDWPPDLPEPQAAVEFEVGDAPLVSDAAAELESAGYSLLHGSRTEPWGQVVARLLSPEGLIVGISFAPWMHDA